MKIDLYSEAKVSPRGKVNREDLTRWVNNLLIFLAPVGILYTTSILGILQQPDHLISLKDFVPSKMVQGGMIVYVLSTIQDLLRKFMDSKK